MALNICIEAVIRLFLEIINYIFGDITLLFRGHPEALWTVVLPELLRTIAWVFIFFLVRYLVKIRLVANAIVIGIPVLLKLVATYLITIPIIGWIISPTLYVTAAILSAIAWGFLTLTDETIPFYLRFVGLPGMMILGAISGLIGPFGLLMDVGAIIALSTIPRIIVPLSTLIVILLTWWSPTLFCEMINSGLKLIESVRQEGLVEGVKEALLIIPLIKNRIKKPG